MVTGFQTVDYREDRGVAWITLNRPDVHNALNLQMRDDLWAALDVAEHSPEARVVVFAGAGPNSFSSGADISEFGTTPSFVAARAARHRRDLWRRLERFPKPMIAAVHGWALGAGCELALYCDLRLATPEARFGLPEVSLGYIPSAGGSQMAPRVIGVAGALALALTGETIGAEEALAAGLVSAVVPREKLAAEAERRASTLLLRSPLAIRYGREAIRVGSDLPLENGLALERRLASLLFPSSVLHTSGGPGRPDEHR